MTLKYRDLEIMKRIDVDGGNWEKTAEELSVSKMTISRTRKKPEYRELVLAALEEKGATPDTFADKLIKQMDAKKTVSVRNEDEGGMAKVEVDDNSAQFNALSKFGDIMGVDAPKEFDLKHSMAAMSDEELQKAIDESMESLDGRVQHSIAGSYNAADIITNKVADAEPAMAERTAEQAIGPADS